MTPRRRPRCGFGAGRVRRPARLEAVPAASFDALVEARVHAPSFLLRDQAALSDLSSRVAADRRPAPTSGAAQI